MRLRKLLLGGLMAVLLVSLVGCGGGGGGDDRTADVSIEDDTLRFEPSSLDIDLNQEQTFKFINRDDILHNVTISQPRNAGSRPAAMDRTANCMVPLDRTRPRVNRPLVTTSRWTS